MTDRYKMSELEPLIREMTESGGEFVFTTHGTSMLPMLRDGLDQAVLVKPKTKLEKYDVALFKRENGQYILHRVVGENKDGYIFRGDNQIINEYGIKHGQIIAEMSAYIKNGTRVDTSSTEYKKYLKTIYVRCLYKRLRALASKIKHKIIK